MTPNVRVRELPILERAKLYCEALRLHKEEGLSAYEISKRLRISVKTVSKWLKGRRTLRSWSFEELEFLINNYDKLPNEEIAKKLGKSIRAVRSKAYRLGLRKPWGLAVKKSDIPELSPTDAAYIAGFLDGDGCITISGRHTTPEPMVLFDNTDPSIIRWLLKKLGSKHNIRRGKPKKGKWRPTMRVAVTGIADVYYLLKQLLPYLIIKREQAELTLKYCESRLNKVGKRPPITSEELALVDKIRELNKRGAGGVHSGPKG